MTSTIFEQSLTYKVRKALQDHPTLAYRGWDHSSLAGIPKVVRKPRSQFPWSFLFGEAEERVAYIEEYTDGRPPRIVCEAQEAFAFFKEADIDHPHLVIEMV